MDRNSLPDLWPAVADPERSALPSDMTSVRVAAGRLADVISPAFAQHLLAPLERRVGEPLVDSVRVTKGLLLHRFTRRAQIDCARRLYEAQIPVVYMKGFASAHTLYDTPDARIAGDLDALVLDGDLLRAVALLAAAGFRFRDGDVNTRWGFTATSSYVPFVSADGSCNLDLHTAPDSDPLDRALPAALVFAEARSITVEGMTLRVPSADHSLVIAISNIVKDRFGLFAAKKIIDAGRMIGRVPLEWARIIEILRRAHLATPARAAVALLSDLGFQGIPSGLARAPGGIAGREYARILAETRALYPSQGGSLTVMRREFLLGGGLPVALRRNRRRLVGLVRPSRGMPA